MIYGRDEDSWEQMTEAGTHFLEEIARNRTTTTYTDLNAELVEQTGRRAFDFDQAAERAAVGYLLGRIVDGTYSQTGSMLSAVVRYAGDNSPGPGFFHLAQDMGLLDKQASSQAKDDFWMGQLKALYERYGGT